MAWAHILEYHSVIGQTRGRVTTYSAYADVIPIIHQIGRPCIIKWELAHQGPWDAAVKGSSALRAGLLSLLRDEMAIRLGLDSLVTLLDMERFYGNIDIGISIIEASTLGYPGIILS